MASLELMTWSKSDKRWHKGYKGRRYAVSPKQLNCPATKEQSRTAANDWWTAKQKELDEALGVAKQHPAHVLKVYGLAIKHHRVYAWWHRKYGDLEKATKSEEAVEWLEAALRSDAPPPVEDWLYDPSSDDEDWYMEQFHWRERAEQYDRERQAETATPKEDTIRAHIDQYLDIRKAHAEASGKIGSYETLRYRLDFFRKWLDPSLSSCHSY